MICTVSALLICAISLCGLGGSLGSRHGYCTRNQCFGLIEESMDFPGAREECKTFGGQLLEWNYTVLGNLRTSLPSGLTGRFWIAGNMTEKAAATLQNCSSVSVATGQEFARLPAPCDYILDGFLCHYTFTDHCQALQAREGARVTYTSHMGFQVHGIQTFPPGTFAVMGKVGVEHPDSKYLCYGKDWMRAPWNCEVLKGGCEIGCNSTTGRCTCPARRDLLSNNISCTADPCARCAHSCKPEGDSYACDCRKGYRLAGDGESCVDVDECKEEDPCTADGEVCVNTQGDFKCECQEGFEPEDGVCMDVSICEKCEHRCEKPNGVYECMCMPGYKVSPKDPTRCEMYCPKRDCPAVCIRNSQDSNSESPCYCPIGFILNRVNGTAMCSDINECEGSQCHRCENLYGSFRCSCNQGFRLHKGEKCVAIKTEEEEEEEEEGSGSPPPYPTAAGVQPGAVPSYVKAGSVLGITVFLVLAAVLLFFLVHHAVKRCGSFKLDSLKHSNIDNIFYLQQVTTETYKRLPLDKHFKNDSQVP